MKEYSDNKMCQHDFKCLDVFVYSMFVKSLFDLK